MAKEDGVVVPVLILCVLTLFFFAGILIFTGFHAQVRGELQAAVDAASHAGASKLCSQKHCWAEARLAAAEVLKRHSAHKNFGVTAPLAFDFDSPDSITGNGDQITVTIERGRWVPGAGFESFEDWEASMPGLMGFAAANAVRVAVAASNLSPVPAGGFFSGSAVISASATAAADAVTAVDIPPLAIPICALLSNDGDLNPGQVCTAERLFTKTDRHCGGPGLCNTIPYFPIEPVGANSRQVAGSFPGGRIYYVDAGTTFTCNLTSRPPAPIVTVDPDDDACQFFIDDRYYDFDIYRLEDLFDHFGVIGLPGTAPADENDIRNALNGSGTRSSMLGDPFYVLDSGLTDPASKAAVWSQISNRGLGDSDGSHPAYSSTSLQEIVEHYVYRASRTLDGPGFGRCNSERYTYGHTDPSGKYIKLMKSTSVWKVRLPIIADRHGQTCRNDADQLTETPVSGGSSRPWEIIGFVDALIHDVDIGEPPDLYPVRAPAFWDHELNRDWSSVPWPTIAPFTDPNCNLIRGKIECGADFLPKSSSTTMRKTVLVP